MRVLVTAASKYGATRDIAQSIGDALADEGHTVTVVPIEETDRYAAFVPAADRAAAAAFEEAFLA